MKFVAVWLDAKTMTLHIQGKVSSDVKLDDLYRKLSCRLVEAVHGVIARDLVLIVDEEGLLKSDPVYTFVDSSNPMHPVACVNSYALVHRDRAGNWTWPPVARLRTILHGIADRSVPPQAVLVTGFPPQEMDEIRTIIEATIPLVSY